MARKDISDLRVVQACEEAHKGEIALCALDLLNQSTEQPIKVCLRAMERTLDRGYIDYGVSLRTAWVTEKGEELLAQEEERQKKVLWGGLRGEWALPSVMKVLGASKELIDSTMQGLRTKELTWWVVGLEVSRQIHAKLVSLGEIDPNTIYNLGTKDQTQEPQHGDVGIMEGHSFIYQEGAGWCNTTQTKN